MLHLTAGGPQGAPRRRPPARAERAEEEARAGRAARDPAAAKETLGVPGEGSRGLLDPTKLQPSRVRMLGPKDLACPL